MNTIYLIIVGFLLLLAIVDLFVGVSNDAVNFLNSAIGSRVARLRTVIIIASAGVLLGALMSSGMMDIARHGVMHPSYFSFNEVMIVFLSVMVTDVVLLDLFNSKGLPTSTTVSMVFELLGATFVSALLKMRSDSSLSLPLLMNGDKATGMITAIFVSVAIAFVTGLVIQWFLRLMYTFYYKNRLSKVIGYFGGIAFTVLAYFIIVKGLGKSPLLPDSAKLWMSENKTILIIAIFVATFLLSQLLLLCRIDVLKIIVLTGTFALALAFAGNDLVNFIGVPLASLDALLDFLHNGNGNADSFLMTSLEGSAKSPMIYLLLAGIIMVVAMATSKKAHNVVQTELSLARQNTGAENLPSSRVAEWIVAGSEWMGEKIRKIIPSDVLFWIDQRFDQSNIMLNEGAVYDELRASVNLVLAASLITLGTTYQLPLSTTYVTFMVSMGSSLADRAWGEGTAAYRVTGMLKVIGGWFLTAAGAFLAAAIVAFGLHLGGKIAMIVAIIVAVFFLWKNRK